MSDVLLIDPRDLHPHESVDLDAAHVLVEQIRDTHLFPLPVLIDTDSKVILDGHHRWWAGKELGCARIPCYGVDYMNDDSIRVRSRRPNLIVTKQKVIDMGLSGETFPIKTTRHIYTLPSFLDSISLDELMNSIE